MDLEALPPKGELDDAKSPTDSKLEPDEEPEADAAERAALLRTLDVRLLPVVALMYLASFLDRSNIGNANLAGLSADLRLAPAQYAAAAAIVYASYISFELPSNLVLKRLRPSRWLPTLCVLWGVTTTATGFVHSFGALVGCRLVLGLAESGLFPGMTFLLSIWYPRHALVSRFGLFFSAATLAGAFGGLLARGLVALDGRAGIAGWRWIFIVEGVLTSAIGLAAFLLIPDSPSTARFLTPRQRTLLASWLASDSAHEAHAFSWRAALSGILQPKTLLAALLCLAIALPTFSYALFLPTIVASLGPWSATTAQLMTVPPYVFALLVTLPLCWASDQYKRRAPFLLLSAALGVLGYALLLGAKGARAQYAGTFLAAAGAYAGSALNIPWLANNVRGHAARAAATAVQLGVGQLAGVAAPYVYVHGLRTGHGAALGCMGAAGALAAAMWGLLAWENRRLERRAREREGEDDGWRNTM